MIKEIARLPLALLLLPFRTIGAIRSAMTAASVTLLLVTIVTLNIIWGYPWTGMFAACVSLLVLGFVASRIFRPRLELDLLTPVSTVLGESTHVRVHVRNAGWLPALQCRLSFQRPYPWAKAASPEGLSEIDLPGLAPGQRIDVTLALIAQRRGVHALPTLDCISMFPFHLFRLTKPHQAETTVTVTPRPLSRDDDDQAFELVQSIGAWTRRLLSGDSLEYTGSREYAVGVPVRRWDFASWARLGKPIVREFSATSIQEVELIVDTTQPASSSTQSAHGSRFRRSKIETDLSLERLLSTAATVIGELTSLGIHIELRITGQPESAIGGHGHVADVNPTPMLIRLATAERVGTSQAQAFFAQAFAGVGSKSLLVLRNDGLADQDVGLPSRAVVLTVGSGSETPATESSDAA